MALQISKAAFLGILGIYLEFLLLRFYFFLIIISVLVSFVSYSHLFFKNCSVHSVLFPLDII